MLSLREFAQIAGISRTTVSRAFSGRGKIAPATKARLAALAAELDFRPSPVLQPAGRRTRTGSVGVLYPGFSASYFQDIQRGLQDALLERGVLPIMLAVTGENLHFCLNRLVDHRIDGLVMTMWEPEVTPADLEHLRRLRLPAVALSSDFGKHFAGLDCVDTDDNQGGVLAARHLLELGHRRLGIVHPAKSSARLQGFLDESARQGAAVDPAHFVFSGAGPLPEFLADLVRLLRQPGRPTALFCGTDIIAADVLQAAAAAALAVPAQLSVAGFSDLSFAARLTPPLTTVRQDGLAVGRLAAERVLNRIAGEATPPRPWLVPTVLMPRRSTAPPPVA